MNRQVTLFLSALLFSTALLAQNTVGLLSYDPDNSYDGYNLFFPHNQTNTYLINNCGQVVHVWEDSTYRPGNSVFLDESGDLYRLGGRGAASNGTIHAGGGGEMVERRSWDNDLEWRYFINDTMQRMHHDMVVLDNGNVLVIVWERKLEAEVIAAGRDTSITTGNELWPDKIVELEPMGMDSANIVWEWHAWDHLIQDHDATKNNFGVVADHPELIDVNYTPDSSADWLHVNGIHYNDFLDQIVLSVPTFDEIWVIDHSTTTAQAATSSGGLGGRGGDLMYRWGNPQTYGAGDSTDQMLHYQHDIHWVDLHLSGGDPDYGKLAVFNNRVGDDYSEVGIFNPVFDSYGWEYPMTAGVWGPTDFDWTYTTPDSTAMYSTGLSSVQRLKNGNTLICAGRKGYSFEVTPAEEIVWEYKTPLSSGSAVSQGDVLADNANLTFKMKRYPTFYAAFDGKALESQGYIELNPDTTCPQKTVGIDDLTEEEKGYTIMPNPFRDQFTIEFEAVNAGKNQLEVYDLMGRLLLYKVTDANMVSIDTHTWEAGYYFIKINEQTADRLVLMR